MKKIVVVVAMDKELATLITYLTNVKKLLIRNKEVYFGTLDNNEVIVAKTGIGKVAASSFLTLLIERYNPDVVLNIGIAGAYSKILKTQDTLVVTKAYYSDVDMTSDEFSDLKYGQLDEMPECFESNNTLLLKAQEILKGEAYYGSIATGDQFVTNYEFCSNIVNTYFSNADILAFDMESAAFLHVCYLYNIPCLVIRTISDIIGSTTPLDYAHFSTLASYKVGMVCRKLIGSL